MRSWMRKTLLTTLALVLAGLLSLPSAAQAASDAEVQMLLKEIKALKARVMDLEERLGKVSQESKQASELAKQAQAGSLKASRMIEEGQAQEGQGLLSDLGKRVKIYGTLEVEASYQRTKPQSGSDSSESNLNLSTAEIFFEAQFNKYAKGVLHFLWEQGETEPVDLDEGFILLGDTGDLPAYLMAGRIYPAVALFETNMVSDPVTKNIFETQATAAEVGYNGEWFSLGGGLYNSSLHETGDDPDNNINTFYLQAGLQTPEGALGDLSLQLHAAYTNNIAGGNFLSDNIEGSRVESLVGGWSASLLAEYKWLSFIFEYMGALDDFKAGELGFSGSAQARPAAWYLEAALTPITDWTFALRYEATSDLFNQEPEKQWGATVSWQFLPDTSLSLEYLRGDYEDDSSRDLVTSKLAVAF